MTSLNWSLMLYKSPVELVIFHLKYFRPKKIHWWEICSGCNNKKSLNVENVIPSPKQRIFFFWPIWCIPNIQHWNRLSTSQLFFARASVLSKQPRPGVRNAANINPHHILEGMFLKKYRSPFVFKEVKWYWECSRLKPYCFICSVNIFVFQAIIFTKYFISQRRNG